MPLQNPLTALSPLQRRSAVVVVGLVALYSLLGFLVAPTLLESQIVDTVRERLGRELRLEEVRVNPFALSVALRGAELSDRDGAVLAAWDEIYVNFQLSSLFRRAYTFAEIRLVRPYANIRIFEDGELSFADAVEALTATDPTDESPASEDGVASQVVAFHVEIDGGRVTFRDASLATPFEEEIGPIDLSLADFSTRPDDVAPYALVLTTQDGEKLSWQGKFSVDPLRSEGRIEIENARLRTGWRYQRDSVHFEVRDGVASTSLNYRVDLSGDAPALELREGLLKLRDLVLVDRAEAPVLELPQLGVSGIEFDYAARSVKVASVTSQGARFHSLRDADGRMRFETFFAAEPSAAGPDPSMRSVTAPVPDEPAWIVEIADVRIDDYGFTFEDHAAASPVILRAEPIGLSVQNLSNRRGELASLDLQLGFANGQVHGTGRAGLVPPLADIDLDIADIELSFLQAYVDDVAALDITRGRARLAGTLAYRSGPAQGPLLRYQGVLGIDEFRSVDRALSEDFVTWKSLALESAIVELEPTRIEIGEIVATRPHARLLIGPKGGTNLETVLGGASDSAPSEVRATDGADIPIEIGALRIVDGSAFFADLSVKPSFATGIEKMNGGIRGLSSDARERARVQLSGQVDSTAPVEISGTVNLLSAEAFTDLKFSFHNIETTTFTPYSGKFAGYKIEKGKLSLDLAYELENRKLVGENSVFLDQFTLGEDVDSPQSTSLPVKLALALLKDANGEIHIDMPVRGDIDDPEFSLGGVILSAFVNLITKAVTSPFSLMAGLLGGDGEELGFVAFAEGQHELADDQVSKIDQLAAVLANRPTLQIEVAGVAERRRDTGGLREAVLRVRLQTAASRAKGVAASAAASEFSLSSDDYARFLGAAYVETFDETPRALLKSHLPEVAAGSPETFDEEAWLLGEMKRRLLDSIEIDDGALRQLALRRAASIRDHLVGKGVEPERIFLLGAELTPSSPERDIRSQLSLKAD